MQSRYNIWLSSAGNFVVRMIPVATWICIQYILHPRLIDVTRLPSHIIITKSSTEHIQILYIAFKFLQLLFTLHVLDSDFLFYQ